MLDTLTIARRLTAAGREPTQANAITDAIRRQERRGCGHVASTAARSSAVKGAACPRPRSAAVRR